MTVFHKTEITPDIWKIMAQRTKVKEALKEIYDMGVADGVNKARTQLKSRVQQSIKNADYLQELVYKHESTIEGFNQQWEELN